MKVIAALYADFAGSSLGTSSRLDKPIHGVPVLRRTVQRLARANRPTSVHVGCPRRFQSQCAELIEGTGAVLHVMEVAPPPWQNLVQPARTWSLNGWRGGIGGTTHFDEFVDARWLAPLMQQVDADAAVIVHPGAALVDPHLTDRMVEHLKQSEETSRLVFAQSPPGLTGLALGRSIVEELAERQTPIGWVFSFKPDAPTKDLITQPPCLEVPGAVRYASGRLVSDTRRGFERLERVLSKHDDPSAEQASEVLLEEQGRRLDDVPTEIEIELTTDDPFPDRLLHPRGEACGTRGPIPLSMIEAIATELGAYDDSLAVLAGFGDPLRYERLRDCLEVLRPKVYGLAVRTAGVDLTEAGFQMLVETGVDVLQIVLDAHTAPTHAHVHGKPVTPVSDFDTLTALINRTNEIRESMRSIRPILVPTMTKAAENLEELDAFHDDWLRRVGSVCIDGASTYGSLWTDHRVTSVAPPQRTPCSRIWTRCVALADGQVISCDQDFQGRQPIGDLRRQSLADIWRSMPADRLRQCHTDGSYMSLPICAGCDEWHRP